MEGACPGSSGAERVVVMCPLTGEGAESGGGGKEAMEEQAPAAKVRRPGGELTRRMSRIVVFLLMLLGKLVQPRETQRQEQDVVGSEQEEGLGQQQPTGKGGESKVSDISCHCRIRVKS